MISCAYRWVVSNAGLSRHKGRIVNSRRRLPWGVPGLAGVFVAGVVAVAHGQSSPVLTAPRTLDKGNGSGDRVIPHDGLWMEPPVLLSPDVPVHRVTVIGGPGGGTVVGGKVSRLGITCEEDPGAGYCNTLGSYVFGPSDPLASARIANDITLARVGGCILDRYVIRVTGDRDGDGSGTALGAYTVDFGLYEACPGAGGNPIQDTAGQVTVPAEEAGIIKEVVFHPSFGANVALPPNLYLGVSFSRDLCGTVVGAPATLGFSVDRFDFPGFPCAAWFGGFPDAPHASFYAEIYVEGNCPDAFVGYKNSNHAGTHYATGVRERFADDIELGVVDCNMVAYEIAHKGDGFIGVDLRSFLSNTDPDRGGLIPGTTFYCFSDGPDVQVCRKEFETPIPLPLSAFYVTYLTSSGYTGPLQTCKKANPGGTANFFMVYTAEEWRPQEFGSGCWGGFELTIFCENTPPTGACCDMILKDEDGEAVCRDNLPEMNCANPVPVLWLEDRECASTCIGGDNAGEPCTRQADCPEGVCPGPFNHPCGVAACCKPEGGCQNLTENECYALEPVDAPRMYQREQFCSESGQQCPIPPCLAREGECTLPRGAFCVAGDRHGLECYPWAYPTECPGQTCLGGPRDGENCDPDNQCPADGRCVDFVCDGGSNHGNSCNPNVECLPGGECTAGQCVGDVGCEKPYCCTSVCEQPGFAYCCTVWWDHMCAAETFRVCEQPPSNDDCYSPDPRDGARLVDIPSFAESDGTRATGEAGEPGFCCNIGHESDPSLGPGSRGFGTVWYKFVAPPNGECDGGDRAGQYCDPNAADPENPVDGCPAGTCLWLPVSVGLDTCCSVARGGTPDDPGGWVRDTLLQVFALSEPDRGLCGDGLTVCSVSEQDCPDGSSCEFDGAYACLTLIPIACSDDEETCSCHGIPQPTRSKACARDLVPGETYYVLVGAKTNRLNERLDAYIDRGVYMLRVWTPCCCTRLMDNDLCTNAELLAGEYVEVPFDISGEAFNRAPATFDCPGPPVTCFDAVETMQNDVWYEWTAPYNAEATFQTCGFDENGDPVDELTSDTAMVVYDGCDCPVQIGTELGCSYFQPSPCFLGSKVTIDVVAGRCYKVRLGGRLGMTHDPMTGDPIAGELRIEVTGRDCNDNGIPDSEDIAAGTSQDCQPNSVPDECEVPPIGTGPDCNDNLTPDVCEVPPIGPPENDCNGNSIPDDCEPDEDCNDNGVQDICDIAGDTSEDCNSNLIPDVCEVPPIGPPENDCNDNSIPDDCEPDEDCNNNGVQDICDLAGSTSEDCNSNEVPDECEPDEDCNNNGVLDICDIGGDTSQDCNSNEVPDECEVPPIGIGPDCNGNLTPDVCEVPPIGPPENDCNSNSIPDDCEPDEDCNNNGVQDICDIAGDTSEDCNGNLTPDVCEVPPIGPPENDCNSNSIPDDCEPDEDCNNNGVQDICDIAGDTSEDCDSNEVPDECEPDEDCNNNGVLDICDIDGDTSQDCNSNDVPDECEVPPIGTGPDCNGNLTPDVCEVPPIGPPENDCNSNSIPDDCEAVMPSIIQQPAPVDQIACVGHVARFTVVADGWEPLTYQWRKDAADLEDGGNVTGATTAVLWIDPAGLNDAGEYDVVVSNVCGTVISNAAMLRTLICAPEGPKFSVVAVRINGTCLDGGNSGEHCTRDIDCDSGVCGGSIARRDTVLVRPGDKIQCEILASDWSWEGQQLSTYQAEIDTDKFQAVPPEQGELIPHRGPRPCQDDLECVDHGVTCMNGFCNTSDDKAGGAFIRLGRADYVFFDLRQFAAVDLHQYRFAATLFDAFDGPAYSAPPKYCGTLIVTVSEDAAGVFTLDLIDYGWSMMLDELRDLILPLETEPLTIRVLQPPKPAPRQPPTER